MLVLDKFPIHIAKTNRKSGFNDYWKINSQGIYNGAVSKFTRAIVMENIHNYIISSLTSQVRGFKLTTCVQLQLDIFIPINYGDIRRKKDGTISWKKADSTYIPDNDEDNISYIWNKAIKDCLTKLKVWEDDNLSYCRGTSSLIHFIDNLEDRRIEINFKTIE